MDPATTRRMRQIIGSLAAIWALLAIGLSVFILVYPLEGPQLPVRTSIIAGIAVVHATSEAAAAAGIDEGDQLLTIGGLPAIQVLLEPRLEAGVLDSYRVRKPDGRILWTCSKRQNQCPRTPTLSTGMASCYKAQGT